MTVYELLAKLTLDTSEYEGNLNNARDSAEKGGSGIGAALGKAGKVAGAAISAASTAIVGFGKKAIDASVSYESAYFSRLFKTETGMNYTDYLQLLRILRGQELLCETDASISAIADQCGFSGSSYFSGCFRQLTGMTPHMWREKYREAVV